LLLDLPLDLPDVPGVREIRDAERERTRSGRRPRRGTKRRGRRRGRGLPTDRRLRRRRRRGARGLGQLLLGRARRGRRAAPPTPVGEPPRNSPRAPPRGEIAGPPGARGPPGGARRPRGGWGRGRPRAPGRPLGEPMAATLGVSTTNTGLVRVSVHIDAPRMTIAKNTTWANADTTAGASGSRSRPNAGPMWKLAGRATAWAGVSALPSRLGHHTESLDA